MRFSAVVFDMDGVLIDSERILRDAWTAAAAELGRDLPATLFQRIIGTSRATADRILREELGDDFPLAEVFARARLLVEVAVADGWPAKPHALELLARLAELGVPVAVASSTRRTAVEQRLETAGLLRYVAAICAGDEVSEGKPHPEIYLTAADRIDAAPVCCIAIEDSLHGARSAHAAGMRTVLVPDLVVPPQPLPAAVHHRFDSLAATRPHLLAWLGRPG
ncbi:MAG: HAD family phosphatase [Pseudomonadales bacterium]|jgi:beta-phosphoglucomutase-like phosphatase (HAD superfamily)|nr:HAD family phosphatase [Pseudomonadales bacterium]